MLGIRKYLGASIDLWQGEVTQFVCDAIMSPPLPAWQGGGSAEESSLQSALVAGFKQADEKGVRHVAVSFVGIATSSFPPERAARSAMLSSRQYLEASMSSVSGRPDGARALRRLTFVLDNGSLYDTFQQALFREYPEDLLGTKA